MTQTLNIEARRPLTRREVEQVQAYVDRLTQGSDVAAREKVIDWASLDALFAGKSIGGDKSSVELVHEAMAGWADEVDRTSK